MSRDTTYVIGTIVEAEWLNDLQDTQTGLMWGVKLTQPTANAVETAIAGTDSLSPIIIDGKRTWKSAASASAPGSGSAGSRYIWASTNSGLEPDYIVEVLPTASVPVLPNYRKIGSATWNGTTTLYDIKLTNGVRADAAQENQFTFRSIADNVSDVPLRLSGQANQFAGNSVLLSVGSDPGSGFIEYLHLSAKGVAEFSPLLGTTSIIHSLVSGDSVPKFDVLGSGKIGWSSGSSVADVFLERTAAGTLFLSDLSGDEGRLDLTYLTNSTLSGSGYVNVEDDLNIGPGSVLRYNGVQFGSGQLLDSANIAHLSGTEAFTGLKSFSALSTFSAGQAITGLLGVDRQGTAVADSLFGSRVGVEANYRFQSTVAGDLSWGAGGASPVDVTISRTNANELSLATGDYIKQSYDALVSEPDVLVNRSVLDAAITGGTSTRAFAYFLS
jgi:hypothetical protein